MSDRFYLTDRPRKSAATLLFALLAVAILPANLAAQSLRDRIDQILSTEVAQTAFWGVYVQDLASGEVFYEHNATKAFLPASNQKLLTTATALDALGAGYRYETVLYFDGSVRGDVLKGNLIIKGSGDPTFGSSLDSGEDPLRQWARSLAEMGVKRIDGDVIGDDDVFDDRPYAEGWDIDYVTSQASRVLGVSTSGLAYSDNVVEVKITASRAGQSPTITTRPAGFLNIQNGLTTAQRSRGIAVEKWRDFGSETIHLNGSIPRTYAGTIVMPVTNPTLFAAYTLLRYLEEYGIDVTGGAADIDDLRGFNYRTDVPLFVHLSTPLSGIIRIVNKESNNFYAEQVFRSFSWGGSAGGGENRVKQLLSEAGAPTNGVAVRDGSGLSRKNMVTPEAIGKLLAYMRRHPEHEVFFASLAEGGEPRSTLRYRLHNVPVRAKTGSLEYVRSLSGYTTTASGRPLVFAVFANHYTGPSYQITQTIDRIVLELASAGASS